MLCRIIVRNGKTVNFFLVLLASDAQLSAFIRPMAQGGCTRKRPGTIPASFTHSTMRTALKSSINAAPQICAYHSTHGLATAYSHRSDAITIAESLLPASHQYWGQDRR